MGSATSLSKKSSSSRFNEVFTNHSLRKGCADLRTNAELRATFVDFLLGGQWHEAVTNLEPRCTSRRKEGSIWRKFGYNEVCHAGECAMVPSASGARSSGTPDIPAYGAAGLRASFIYKASDSVPLCILSNDNDLRPLLVCVAYPIFLSNVVNARMTDSASEYPVQKILGSEVSCSGHPYRNSQRLHEVLLYAAATFNHAELARYLAAPENNYISDLKSAIQAMAIKIMIAKVDKDEEESCIVYTNIKSGDKQRTLLSESEPGLLGQDLHVLFGNICSPGGADVIRRAVFMGKLYKQSFALADGSVKLLAICPVPGKDGVVKYAVSLESEAFTEVASDAQACAHHFEGIENLLVLLPLLVRV